MTTQQGMLGQLGRNLLGDGHIGAEVQLLDDMHSRQGLLDRQARWGLSILFKQERELGPLLCHRTRLKACFA